MKAHHISIRHISILCLASAVVLPFAQQSTLAGAPIFRTVVLTGDPAPGTGDSFTFNSVYPVINAAGQTAFQAILTGPGVNGTNDRGIWSEGTGTLTLVAREGSSAPGTAAGVAFKGFWDPPFLSDDGAVGFSGSLSGPGVVIGVNDAGVWSEAPGPLSLIARRSSPAPGIGGGVDFSILSSPNFGPTGDAVFFSLLAGAGAGEYRSIWSEAPGVLSLIAQMGSAAPGTEVGVVFDHFSFPLISGAGHTAFRATLSGPGIDPTNDLSIWIDDSGTLDLVTRHGSMAPGAGAGVVFSDFNDVMPSVNDLGQTAFAAGISGPGVTSANDRGMWSGEAGSLNLIAREGSQAPGTDPGVVFSEVLINEIPGVPGDPFALPAFTGYVVGGGGHAAFVGSLTGPGVDDTNNVGIWSEASGGALELIARTGSNAPGTAPGVNFAFFGFVPSDALALNASGHAAFRGTLVGSGVDSSNNSGIWAQDSSGVLSLVVRAGDVPEVAPGDFRTVLYMDFVGASGGQDGRARTFNDAEQVVFGAHFTNGSTGIFVATQTLSCSPGACSLGDVDQDGDVDLADYAVLLDCMEEPGTLPEPTSSTTPADCLNNFDSDGDSDVDLMDFAIFMCDFTG
ncbi:MAG: hypothetical protein GXP29_02920 [Planctomycetes bacterium]|nr:hypothetical protein [Planctomycetota bacterium]